MKIYTYLVIVFLFIFSCQEQTKNTVFDKKEITKVYSKQELQQLVNSLKYDYDGSGNNDFESDSDIAIKIKHIGKPTISYLLEKLDDTTATKKQILFSTEKYAVGDVARLYLWQIIGSDNWLKPTEDEIINKILPNIIQQYRKDTVIVHSKDSIASKAVNTDLYDYFIHNGNYKMPEQERRKRYKEEFIKALNKDLLNTDKK